ncbi:hypothetical protein AMYX_03570 [Anaeromyxobacter diazotrophicus]|uniref:Uncharacterized protein n=2 Tax=Anaeromyxobacter diazotrophicus TaxID=2590199 RepID=A0A7I9VGU8_9BACT|nr:hypothetical protein AMYX_03570 [Anaeromyxobacter diazotrophicus]
MVTGFNHNVKHRGKAYHIQTEDSGVANPQITTHLFVGGNILATKKTSYADIASAENLGQVVRELMEEQHKEMLRNLVNGVYDDRDEALSSQARAYQPGQLAGEPAAPPRPAAPAAPAKPPPPPAAAPPVAGRPAQPAPQVVFRPAVTPPPVLSRPAAPPPLPGHPPAAGAPRPSAARPAAPAPADALFGDDLASEKSLDEVILSYLSEEPGRRK